MQNTLNFFTTNSMPANFKTFGQVHLFILFVAVTISIYICKKNKENRKLELFIGSVLVFQQITLYSWYIIGGFNTIKEGLPLYHCRVAIICIGLGLVLNRNILMKIGSYIGIFGAIGALLFPSLDPFAFPHITQFSFFIGHLFLLWGSVYLLMVKKIGMSKDDLKHSLIYINIYHVLMFILNNSLHSNYGYMNAPPFYIGVDLHPLLNGVVVMIIFSVILLTEYIFINNLKVSKEDSNEYSLVQ